MVIYTLATSMTITILVTRCNPTGLNLVLIQPCLDIHTYPVHRL